MIFQKEIELTVKKGISHTFYLTFVPGSSGTLSVSSSCSCTTFKQNRFDVAQDVPQKIECYMTKWADFQGSVSYFMTNKEGVPENVGLTTIKVIVE